MRFKITLALKEAPSYLPFNYQYELSGWIYKVLKNADANYSDFLHNDGYIVNDLKNFKLFCFSNLQLPKFQSQKNCIRIDSREIHFQISFYMEKGNETFILGLFREQKGSIGNKDFRLDFMVKDVQVIDYAIIEEKITLKTLSPLVISKKNERGNADYLSPFDEDYAFLFFNNLLEKYKSTGKSASLEWQNFPSKLTILTEKPASKLITIKGNSEAETKVKGYIFDFELVAPIALIELGIMAGFGNENAMGFGCCGILK